TLSTSSILHYCALSDSLLFFFHDTATTEIYPLSLHDALPIFAVLVRGILALRFHLGDLSGCGQRRPPRAAHGGRFAARHPDQTRSEEHTSELSHVAISYAVFCLKKKKQKKKNKNQDRHDNNST